MIVRAIKELSVKIGNKEYKEKVKSLRIEEDIRSAPYGRADFILEQEDDIFETGGFVKTGEFVTISVSDGTEYFGIIKSVSQSIRTLPNGIRITEISISSVSWAYLLMRGEFKQTLNRGVGDISEVNKSAIFQVSDYSEGILKVLREELEKQSNPAVVLESLIKELAHYKLPDGSEIGDFITVYDGKRTSELSPYNGSPANVIKGVILTQFKGVYSNNISHWGIINQLFNVLPQLFELFCFTTSFKGEPQLNIMFRYKPLNPTHTYNQYTLMKEFFPTRKIRQRMLNHNFITELRYSFDEEDHINMVFVENPFASAEGHQKNMFRNNTLPIFDADDINERGLRSLSLTSPFVSAKGSTTEIKRRNLRLHNAIAQRLYLTHGLGSRFCRGVITLVGGRLPVVGQWVLIRKSGRRSSFYIHRISKSYMRTSEGIFQTEYNLHFERGSFTNEVVRFKEPDYPEETASRKTNKKKKT